MSNADQLTTYAELADVITHLPLIVREARRQRRLSLRAAAREMDLAGSTVMRLESGQGLDGATIAAVLRWLDGPKERK